MGNPHILAIPYPAQGHVIPLMELSQCLAKEGFKITFVKTEYDHRRVLNALLAEKDYFDDGHISLVSIPDGLELWEDRKELEKLTESIVRVLPGKLEELIDRINTNASADEKITCVIADASIGFAFDIAEEKKLKRAAFWPASVAVLDVLQNFQKLTDDGIIDSDGTILKNQMLQLAPSPPMPDMTNAKFLWHIDWMVCNSAYDIEPGAFDFSPNNLPIGPLLASNRLGNSAGNFWPGDSSCLQWLDQQLSKSVLYVAFGTLAVFDKNQFQELAIGLELSSKPFLWVVRSDITKETDVFPEGLHERTTARGRMVQWAPQQKVLSHPAIACFLSHCGWNSTMEGVSNGVPFLCWPCFSDQFLNQSYICDIWKAGLKFSRYENGIITREEIKGRVEQVFGDEKLNIRALELKEIAIKNVGECGNSSKNLKNFIDRLKPKASSS